MDLTYGITVVIFSKERKSIQIILCILYCMRISRNKEKWKENFESNILECTKSIAKSDMKF